MSRLQVVALVAGLAWLGCLGWVLVLVWRHKPADKDTIHPAVQARLDQLLAAAGHRSTAKVEAVLAELDWEPEDA